MFPEGMLLVPGYLLLVVLRKVESLSGCLWLCALFDMFKVKGSGLKVKIQRWFYSVP